MNELKYFYKEANALESVIKEVAQRLNIPNEIKFQSSPPAENPNAAAYVSQKETTQTDPSGSQTVTRETDPTINFVLSNLNKEMGEVLSHLGNASSSSGLDNAFKTLQDIGKSKLEDLMGQPEKLKELTESYNVVSNIMPVLKRISEIFAHELEHLNVGEEEELHSETEAESAEHMGSKDLLNKLRSSYPGIDTTIDKIKNFFENLDKVSDNIKSANLKPNAYDYNIERSIINRDVRALAKMANILDLHGYVAEADLVDSIIELELG